MARPAMTNARISARCPQCREEFQMTIGPHSTILEVWSLFYKAYEEHYDAVHAESWQKLARDAVRQWRLCGPLPGNAVDLESRLEKLEATSANR